MWGFLSLRHHFTFYLHSECIRKKIWSLPFFVFSWPWSLEQPMIFMSRSSLTTRHHQTWKRMRSSSSWKFSSLASWIRLRWRESSRVSLSEQRWWLRPSANTPWFRPSGPMVRGQSPFTSWFWSTKSMPTFRTDSSSQLPWSFTPRMNPS